MAKVMQYYGDTLAPLTIEAPADEPLRAWRSQRARLRAWLADLPADAWEQPTRCDEWNVTQLVQHLITGAQFLGYTLHEASKGNATELLRDFDTHATVQAATGTLDGTAPADLLVALEEVDARIDAEAQRLADGGWTAIAEAPPGHLPAQLVLNHFVWDSWVHEHDLMLPRGEHPPLDPLEAEVTLRYILGVAAAVDGDLSYRLEVHATDLDVRLLVDGDGERVTVRRTDEPSDAPRVAGPVRTLLDRTTGREADQLDGDPEAFEILDRMGATLAN